MKDDLSSYFEDPEFIESLEKYEGMVENHTPAYFDAEELTDIAEYYTSEGRLTEAKAAIDYALHLHPNDTDALIFRARSLAMEGKVEEAYMTMDLIEDHSDREVKFLQADLLIDENRLEEADQIFRTLAANEEEVLDTIFDIIMAYIDANQEEMAEKWIKRIDEYSSLSVNTENNQQFRDILCDFYLTFNKPELAIPILQTTLNHYPYSIRHWNDLAKCLLTSNNFEEAHEALDFALAIDDSNLETLTLKAFCYRQSGNLQEASEYYLRLAENSNNKTRPYLALAKVYLDMQDYDSAIEYIEILLECESKLSAYEQSELYGDIALCHAALKHVSVGQKFIRRSIELNQYEPETHINAGRFYLLESKACIESEKEENENKGELEFQKALELTPEDEHYDTLLQIASACFDQQNFKLAAKYFEQINQKFPDNAEAIYLFLIYCYFYLQEITPCMHYLAIAKKETPDLFESLGVNDSMIPDKRFNDFLRSMNENINNGIIDIDKFL